MLQRNQDNHFYEHYVLPLSFYMWQSNKLYIIFQLSIPNKIDHKNCFKICHDKLTTMNCWGFLFEYLDVLLLNYCYSLFMLVEIFWWLNSIFPTRYKREFGFVIEDRSIIIDDIIVRASAMSKVPLIKEAPQSTEPPHVEKVFFFMLVIFLRY